MHLCILLTFGLGLLQKRGVSRKGRLASAGKFLGVLDLTRGIAVRFDVAVEESI